MFQIDLSQAAIGATIVASEAQPSFSRKHSDEVSTTELDGADWKALDRADIFDGDTHHHVVPPQSRSALVRSATSPGCHAGSSGGGKFRRPIESRVGRFEWLAATKRDVDLADRRQSACYRDPSAMFIDPLVFLLRSHRSAGNRIHKTFNRTSP
jgi:hypothetical protein